MRITRFRPLQALIGVMLFWGCGGSGGDPITPPPSNPPQVRGVTVTPATATLRVGDSQSLSALVDAVNGAANTVTWSSESPTVAAVSASGVVSAVAPGSAVVRATSSFNNAVSGTAIITVQARRTLTVSPATVTMGSGQTAALTFSMQIEAGLPTTVTWRTSAATVATVSAAGVVSGVALGSATITAVSTYDTTLTASASVNVVPVVRSVSVTPTTASVFIAASQQLTATVNADAGVAQTLTWRSANAAVATVSATGLVTAVGLGSTTITALSTVDTLRRAVATITVPARPVGISITQRNVSINPGTTLPLTAVVTADPGVSTVVNWSSSNSAAATVNAQGVLTGVASGTALITATAAADVSKRDTVTVSVVPRLAATWTPSRLGGALYEDIVGLATIDATSAFAVNSVGDIYRWNGTAWQPNATGASLGTTFYAIHGTSATNIIAVGANGVVVRWNGTTWNAMASGTTRSLYSVWVEDATTAYAVGENGVVLRLSGNTWSTEAAGSTVPLYGVWSGAGTVVAVGANGELLRKTGATWARASVPSFESLYAVHGVSATDVVVGGAAGTLLRFDGTAWSLVPVGGFSGDIFAITGSAANGGRRYLAGDGAAAQLDGSTVSLVTTPYAPSLYAATTDVTGVVWVGGQRGLVMRSGSPWTTLNLAPDLLDVWTSSPTSAYAVGEFGSVYRWNGTTWTRQTVPTSVTLEAVWSPSANDAFVGGDNGTMLRFNGTTWSVMPFPSTASVYNIWGTSGSNAYAVTSDGEVLRWNGGAWTLVNTAPQALWTVYGASPTDIIVAGENGVVQRFNGTTWTTLPAPTSGTLAGLWLTSGSDIYSVGANTAGTAGAAFNFNGTSWSALQVGSARLLTSVWGPSLSDLYVTGDLGTLLRYNGTSWTSVSTGTTDLLWSLSSAPSAIGGAFAVGYNSTVLAGAGGSLLREGIAKAAGSLEPGARGRAVRGAMPKGGARKARR